MLLQANHCTLLLWSLSAVLNAGIRTCVVVFKVNTTVWRLGLDVKGTDSRRLAGEGEGFA